MNRLLRSICNGAVAVVTAVPRYPAIFFLLLVAFNPRLLFSWKWALVGLHTIPEGLMEVTVHSLAVAAVPAAVVCALLRLLSRAPAEAPPNGVATAVIGVVVALRLAVELATVLNFNTSLTAQMLATVLETTGREAREFVTTFGTSRATLTAVAWTAVWLLLLGVAWRTAPMMARMAGRPMPRVVFGLIVSALLVDGVYQIVRSLHPVDSIAELEMADEHTFATDLLTSDVNAVRGVRLQQAEMRRAVRHALATDPAHTATAEAFDSTVVVLIIGESYARSHAQIYGYPLPTTPNMMREVQQGHMAVFADAISPYNLTSITLKNLFSCNSISRGEPWTDHPLFTAVFRQAGYAVDLWDNQRDFMAGSVFTFSLGAYLYNPDIAPHIYSATNDSTFAYDGLLIDNYRRCAAHLGGAERRLVIFHLMGQHMTYADRYPQQYNVFSATDVPVRRGMSLSVAERSVVACYDNATRYNDAVVDAVLRLFEHRQAVVVMLADHGEEVYDWRHFMGRDHEPNKSAQAIRCQYDIPLCVWFSARYRQAHPDVVQRTFAAAERPFSSDNLCRLLFTLGGVMCPQYRSDLDVTADDYRPGERLVGDTCHYDRAVVTGSVQR